MGLTPRDRLLSRHTQPCGLRRRRDGTALRRTAGRLRPGTRPGVRRRWRAEVGTRRQQAAQLADVALGVNAAFKHAKAHVYLPANRLLVAAGRPEPSRLRALVAIGARYAERGDAHVAEGEDDVALRDFARGLLEGMASLVSVAFERLEIAAGDFVAVSLVLIDHQ
jgi:hypothetical protein